MKNKFIVTLTCFLLTLVCAFTVACDLSSPSQPSQNIDTTKQDSNTYVTDGWSVLEKYGYDLSDYAEEYAKIIQDIANATTEKQLEEYKLQFDALVKTANKAIEEFIAYKESALDSLDESWKNCKHDTKDYEAKYDEICGEIFMATTKDVIDVKKEEFAALLKKIDDEAKQDAPDKELVAYKQQILSEIADDWATQTTLYGDLLKYQEQYAAIRAAVENAATKDLVDAEYQKYQTLTATIKQTEVSFDQYKSQVLQSAETSWNGISGKTYANNLEADYNQYYTAIADAQDWTALKTAINKFNSFIESAQELLTYAQNAFETDNATWYELQTTVGAEFMSAYQSELAALETFDNVKTKQDVDDVTAKRTALYNKIQAAYDAFTETKTSAVSTAQSEWSELTSGYVLADNILTSYSECLEAMRNAKTSAALDAAKQTFTQLKAEAQAAISEQAALKQQKDELQKQIDKELNGLQDNVKAFFESQLSQMKKEVESITESIDVSNYQTKLSDLATKAQTLKEAFTAASDDNLETLSFCLLDYISYEWSAVCGAYKDQVTEDLQSEYLRVVDQFKMSSTLNDVNDTVQNFVSLKNSVKNNVTITSASLAKNIFKVNVNSGVQDFLTANVVGNKITVKYSNSTTETVNVTSAMFSADNLDFSKVSMQTLAVTYQTQTIYIVISVSPDVTNATVLDTYEITDYDLKRLGTTLKIYGNGYAGISCKEYSGVTLTDEAEYFVSYEKVADNLYLLKKDVRLLVKTSAATDKHTVEYYKPSEVGNQYTILDVYGNVTDTIIVYGEYNAAGNYPATLNTYSYGQITTYIFLDKENNTVSCSAFPEQRLPLTNTENTVFSDYVLNGTSITLDLSKIISAFQKDMEAEWKKLSTDTTTITEVKAVYDDYVTVLQSCSSANDVMSVYGNFSSFCQALNYPSLSGNTFNGKTELSAYVGDSVNDFLTENVIGKTVTLKYSVNYTAGISIPTTLYYTKTITLTKDMVNIEGMTYTDKFQYACELSINISLGDTSSMGMQPLSLRLTVKYDKAKMLSDMQTTWDNLTAQGYKTNLFAQNYEMIKNNLSNADDYLLGTYVSEFNNLVENVKNLTVSTISVNTENFPKSVNANTSVQEFITANVLTLKATAYYDGASGDGEQFTVTQDMVSYSPNSSTTFIENTTYTFTITYESCPLTLSVTVGGNVSSIIADFDNQWKQLSSSGYDTAPFDKYYNENIVNALKNDSSQENIEYLKHQFELLVGEVQMNGPFSAQLMGIETSFTVNEGENVEDFISENILKGSLEITYSSVYASPVTVSITRDMIQRSNTDLTFTGGNYTFEILYKNTLTGITIWAAVNETLI